MTGGIVRITIHIRNTQNYGERTNWGMRRQWALPNPKRGLVPRLPSGGPGGTDEGNQLTEKEKEKWKNQN